MYFIGPISHQTKTYFTFAPTLPKMKKKLFAFQVEFICAYWTTLKIQAEKVHI